MILLEELKKIKVRSDVKGFALIDCLVFVACLLPFSALTPSTFYTVHDSGNFCYQIVAPEVQMLAEDRKAHFAGHLSRIFRVELPISAEDKNRRGMTMNNTIGVESCHCSQRSGTNRIDMCNTNGEISFAHYPSYLS
jgi:hypothetical protein